MWVFVCLWFIFGNPKASAYINTTYNVKVKLALRVDASSVNDM